MKYIRKFAGWILLAELVLASVLLVGLFAPLPGKVEFKIVESGSMEPRVPVGSVVVITPAPHYAVGDIITFGNDTKKRIPTTHRIAGIEREGGSIRYITKGDANEEADNGRTSYDEVIGKVVVTVPRLGYILDFARSKNGFVFMVVIPAALIVLDELITIGGAVVAMRRKKVGSPQSAASSTLGKRGMPVYEPRIRTPYAATDGIVRVERPTRTSRRRSTMQERLRAGIDGYMVVLRPV